MAIGLCFFVLVDGPDDLQSLSAINTFIHTHSQRFLAGFLTHNRSYLWKIMSNQPISFLCIFCLHLVTLFKKQQSFSHTFVNLLPRLAIITHFSQRRRTETINLLRKEFFHYIKLNNLTIERPSTLLLPQRRYPLLQLYSYL